MDASNIKITTQGDNWEEDWIEVGQDDYKNIKEIQPNASTGVMEMKKQKFSLKKSIVGLFSKKNKQADSNTNNE